MLWNFAPNSSHVGITRLRPKDDNLFLLEFRKIIALLEARGPKKTPARWRGKGVSKAHYDQSNTNNDFENIQLQLRGKGGKKDDDEDEDKQGRDGSSDSGDGDRDGDDDPVQAETNDSQVDARQFYGYLFEKDKKPSKILDAMLRGIARHIIDNIEPKNDRHLTPTKLSAFYKLVGGNYDSLFIDVPHVSISWIYAAIGCCHSLQPNGDNFSPPSVPALTEQGFVRWQAIEILLGPDEHVPFIQNCIEQFGIKNPDDGSDFPKGLPKEAFPLTPDTEMEKWHSQCAQELRERATSQMEDEKARTTV